MIKLNYNNIKIGMIVIDTDGDIGIIIECNDIHNILVSYKNGSAIFCMSPNCRNDILYLFDS